MKNLFMAFAFLLSSQAAIAQSLACQKILSQSYLTVADISNLNGEFVVVIHNDGSIELINRINSLAITSLKSKPAEPDLALNPGRYQGPTGEIGVQEKHYANTSEIKIDHSVTFVMNASPELQSKIVELITKRFRVSAAIGTYFQYGNACELIEPSDKILNILNAATNQTVAPTADGFAKLQPTRIYVADSTITNAQIDAAVDNAFARLAASRAENSRLSTNAHVAGFAASLTPVGVLAAIVTIVAVISSLPNCSGM